MSGQGNTEAQTLGACLARAFDSLTRAAELADRLDVEGGPAIRGLAELVALLPDGPGRRAPWPCGHES